MRRFLKWAGIVLAVLIVIGLAVNTWFVWTTGARLERQLAGIRKAGDPVSLRELAPKPIPPEKNANTYLRQANADVEAVYALLYPYRSESGDETWEASYDAWSGRNPRSPMPAKLQRSLEAIFSAHPNVIPLLKQAAACPDYDAQLDYELLLKESLEYAQPSKEPPSPGLLPDILTKMRNAAVVLVCQGHLLVAEGNRDEAVRTALAIFRLSRHCGRNLGVTSNLVALMIATIAVDCANGALQTDPISPEVRQALDTELASQERMDGFIWALKSERAFAIELFQNLPLRNFWLMSRGRWNQRESEYLDEMQAFLAMLNDARSYSETIEAIRRIEADRPPGWNDIFSMRIVGMQHIQDATVRTQAMIRCLRVLNALQTHVPTGSNIVPKLTDLGLPVETTTDPFDGQPLHVKKMPNGWLVYSIGPDLQDDGGKLDYGDTFDVGVGPPTPAAKPDEPAGK